MKKIILIFTILLLYVSIFATQQNTFELQRLSEKFKIEYEQKRAEAYQKAAQMNWPTTFTTDEGSFAELQILDEFGMPQYYITHNANAAQTISTDEVYTGGSAGLSLSGTGIVVREWDGGGVRLTHQEFGSRVTQVDGPISTHYHSTHVAGTIMASGVVAAAKGMAFAATLRAFDWNSDTSEMASEAALGALISNHSYGYTRGWSYDPGPPSWWYWYGSVSVSTTEDYLFGFYDSNSQQHDQIAYNAPDYLIVKSAGNDRNDSYAGLHKYWNGSSWVNSTASRDPDGPYDCIGTVGVAKNVLTVGAVNDISGGYSQPSDVTMSTFSSWGPADDGRIKPDISANGVSLYSTDDDSNTDYTTLSGTSMATPSVTGSLALLQEYYISQNSTNMLAATLKGLVIHTADEAGSNNGPDYEFGWGLMNTESAANVISNNGTTDYILEASLSSGGSYTLNLNSDGSSPLVATICWTDPAHAALSPALNPTTKLLVNDLDIRITKTGSTYYPWKLDGANPSNAATNSGDNNTDNIEKVEISNPSSDEYTITITHKGTLSSSQNYSLIISGIDSSVLVSTPTFSPAGGTYSSTQSVTISCATSGSTIYYTTDGSDPTTSSNLYSTPVSVSTSSTLKAKAFHLLWSDSSIASATYAFDQSSGSGNNGGGSGSAYVDMPLTNIDGSSVDPDVWIDPAGTVPITVNVTVTDQVQGSTPVPNPDNVIISYDVDITGTITGVNLVFDLEFTGLTGLDQIHWLNGTNWEVPNNVSWSTPDHVTFDLILPAGRDGSTEIILSGDNPLPVNLSSFTAAYIDGSPVINWVTQSETDNIGWNIYRSNSYNFGQAFMLNINTIPGNGTTSQPSFYSYTDEYEVFESFTYWYWLESISGSGETESYGPVSLTIPSEGNDIPEIPLATELRQNFPNPFNPSTLISFDIKENETGLLSIYNIMGQLIVTEEFETGRHQYAWDGRDHASGVYLYKLKTKYYSKIMKMLLVK